MGLIGKLQAETLIMASADKFHEIFWCRPHHISNVCPTKIQKVHLHEGEWGTSGSVIQWHYNIGKPANSQPTPTPTSIFTVLNLQLYMLSS